MDRLVQISGSSPWAPPGHASTQVRELWSALREVEDPEFPVSLVDMGLIYGLRRSGGRVEVDLTFTSMGCPCMEFILTDIRKRLMEMPGVEEVSIRIVWDPPWTRRNLSPDAIQKLRSWGVTT